MDNYNSILNRSEQDAIKDKPIEMLVDKYIAQQEMEGNSTNYFNSSMLALGHFLSGMAIGAGMDMMVPLPGDDIELKKLIFAGAPVLGSIIGLNYSKKYHSKKEIAICSVVAGIGSYIGQSAYHLLK